MKRNTSARWLKCSFAVAALAFSMPTFAANWTRGEVAAARTAKRTAPQDESASRCRCSAGCPHAAAPAKATGAAAPSSVASP